MIDPSTSLHVPTLSIEGFTKPEVFNNTKDTHVLHRIV